MFGPAGVELRRPLGRRPAGFPSSGSVIRVLRQASSGLDQVPMSAEIWSVVTSGTPASSAKRGPPRDGCQYLFVHVRGRRNGEAVAHLHHVARVMPTVRPFTAIKC